MPIIMLVVCRKRELDAIVEEWSDRQRTGVQVKLYGVTEKAQDGFLLIEWSASVPELWMNMLKRDEDVLDVLTYDTSFQPVPV
jgi:hypothetical protein